MKLLILIFFFLQASFVYAGFTDDLAGEKNSNNLKLDKKITIEEELIICMEYGICNNNVGIASYTKLLDLSEEIYELTMGYVKCISKNFLDVTNTHKKDITKSQIKDIEAVCNSQMEAVKESFNEENINVPSRYYLSDIRNLTFITLLRQLVRAKKKTKDNGQS